MGFEGVGSNDGNARIALIEVLGDNFRPVGAGVNSFVVPEPVSRVLKKAQKIHHSFVVLMTIADENVLLAALVRLYMIKLPLLQL